MMDEDFAAGVTIGLRCSLAAFTGMVWLILLMEIVR
jgi:hypothetical protein